MTITQTINSGRSTDAFPFSPTGALHRFALVRGEMTVFSDDMSDLIGSVIPGYAGLSLEDATIERWKCAAATATDLQQLMAAAGGLDVAVESEDVLTAIFTDRANALPDGSLTAGEWTHQVPLILVATDYQPFTSALAPNGNVQFLDPSSERAFLVTLAQTGVWQFYTHDAITIQD